MTPSPAEPSIEALAATLLEACRARGWRLVTAESCTGGLIVAALTEVAGSSDVVDRGYVTYSNTAKRADLGVPEATLIEHGAVSEATAKAMAAGALTASGADFAIAVTGIAGPGGGTAEKPVGLVHIACARRDEPCRHEGLRLAGDRRAIRMQSVTRALRMAIDLVVTTASVESPATRP